MPQAEQLSVPNTEPVEGIEDTCPIPPQYGGLPRRIVHELVGDQKQVEAVDAWYDARLSQEAAAYDNWLNTLNDSQHTTFKQVMDDTKNTITTYITDYKNNAYLTEDLSPDQAEVLMRMTQEELDERDGSSEFDHIDKRIIESLRRKLAIKAFYENYSSVEQPDTQKTAFGDFSVKRGETDTGLYWNQFTNRAAKELKETGEFEWGKERLYFDIGENDFVKLRDMVMAVATDAHIPISFKYLDIEESRPHAIDDATTRFVANFVSASDAKAFYNTLRKHPDYEQLQSLGIDYQAEKIDEIVHYASGQRETRAALKNIVEKAVCNPDGTYTFPGLNEGKRLTISAQEYAAFEDRYRELIASAREKWDAA